MEEWPIPPALRFPGVSSDSERFQFIATFRLHVTFHYDHVSLMWQERRLHWEPSAPYYPVASGKTLAEAADAGIERYRRKHGLQPTSSGETVVLEVRGWVS